MSGMVDIIIIFRVLFDSVRIRFPCAHAHGLEMTRRWRLEAHPFALNSKTLVQNVNAYLNLFAILHKFFIFCVKRTKKR